MSDKVLIVVPGLGTLSLSREAFESALAEGVKAIAAPAAPAAEQSALLTVEQLAEKLGDVPTTRLERLAREGRIPSTRVGRSYRFDLPAVKAALASNGHEKRP